MTPDQVLISVPTRGQVQWQTVTVMQMARDYEPRLRPVLYQAGNLSVALTRNRIVQQFLETDCEVLAMVDDDVAPPVNFVELLLPFLGEYAMVGIPHTSPHPAEPDVLINCVYAEADDGLLRPMGLFAGINECFALATGCVLITRDALEQLGPHPFRMEHDPTASIQSDDLLFCADLRTAGFKIGCYWDGHPVDHFRSASLTPIYEAQMERSTTNGTPS